jgi:putative membrane protein
MLRVVQSTVVLGSVMLLVGAAPGRRDSSPVRPLAAAERTRGLDDAAIVGIFDAANGWDIATGSLAERKAARTDVREFGAMLARDHRAVRQQGRDLAKRLGVTPTPVAKDFALLVDYNNAMKRLEGLRGAAFDKAFLEHEVAYHQAVINAVTDQFLPAIKNAELKAFVEKVAPAFQAHMQAAKHLLETGASASEQ